MNNIFYLDLIKKVEEVDESDFTKFKKLLKDYHNYFNDISILLYEKLEKVDQKRFIVWFLKRWGKVNIINKIEYHQYLQVVKKVKNQLCERISLNDKEYKIQDMDIQGYNFKLAAYDWVLSVHDVYYNQYEHKDFKINEGDVIIDAGGFIGDTAALFCEKTNNNCYVHSFELLDENIELFKYNNQLNNIEEYVKINKLALSDKSKEILFIKESKAEGATSMFGNETSGIEIETITLDDYVIQNNIVKIDFIKMDIEGAEIPALNGAINTINHFKPKLALCLYHKWTDVLSIPRFLNNLNVEYKYYFKWVQLKDGWEAVLLAEPK